jgi:hypothetical protein
MLLPERTWPGWALFGLAWMAAALLVLLVVVAPWLDTDTPEPDGWQLVLHLFAQDAALRRTSMASALGLVVTAHVFFRPGQTPPLPPPPMPPPPPTMAGA